MEKIISAINDSVEVKRKIIGDKTLIETIKKVVDEIINPGIK